MFKKIIALLLGVLLLVGAVACGRTPQADDSEININIPFDTEGTLKVGTEDTDADVNIMNKFVREFNKKFPKVKVEIVRLSGESVGAITQSIAAKEGIDVFWVRGQMQLLAKKKILYNFKDAYDAYCDSGKLDKSNLYESMMKLGEFEGGLYQVPRDYNKIVVAYNKDIFTKYSVPFPTDENWTWQDYLNTCAALRAKMLEDEYPSNSMLLWSSVYETVVQGFGGKLIENGSVKFDLPEAKNGLKELKKLIDLRYTPNPRLQTLDPFLNQKAAMYICSRPVVQDFITARLNVDYINFPALPVKAVVGAGTTGHAISRFARNKDLAFQFLMTTLSEESQDAFSETGSGVPVLKSLADEGVWRDVPTTDINHDAFVVFPERDMPGEYQQGISPELHIDIDGYLQSLLFAIYDGGNIDAETAKYKQSIENAIKNF